MKKRTAKTELQTELFIAPDGRIYVHNLTPEMAEALNALNPDDDTIRRRVITRVDQKTKQMLPAAWHKP